MTAGRIPGTHVTALSVPPTAGKLPAAHVTTLAVPHSNAKLPAAHASVVAAPPTGAQLPALHVTALAFDTYCSTRRCELWKIVRTDGTVFAFTSLDEDVLFCNITFKTCGSLADSASESSSELGQVGDTQIAGILSDDGITDEDLYAGRFDDAYVEVMEINWDPANTIDTQVPFSIQSGYLGKITRQQNSWQAEVLGMGSRLQQTPMVDVCTPGCRLAFGDPETCGVDVDSLATTASVTRSALRDVIFFTGASPDLSLIWNQGKVVWTSGRNAGITCMVDTVDFGSGVLSLWDLAPYPPAAGDTFTLKPGCPKTKTACILYGALLNFGGEPDVPGPDALQSNADSLFTGANG